MQTSSVYKDYISRFLNDNSNVSSWSLGLYYFCKSAFSWVAKFQSFSKLQESRTEFFNSLSRLVLILKKRYIVEYCLNLNLNEDSIFYFLGHKMIWINKCSYISATLNYFGLETWDVPVSYFFVACPRNILKMRDAKYRITGVLLYPNYKMLWI